MGNNNIGIKKCTTSFLWVLNLGQVGGCQKFFQNQTATMIFSKMVSNLLILRLKFGEILGLAILGEFAWGKYLKRGNLGEMN